MATAGDKQKTVFTKEFTRQEPLPDEAIRSAVEMLAEGRLHRYNAAPGRDSQAALLELEFARLLGTEYCLGLNSCGSAIYTALLSAGVGPGEKILCNSFTLAPVPGAVANTGAEAVLVEIDPDLTISFDDLEEKAKATGARFLLLSHMRGHIADLDRVLDICEKYSLTLIEDCAHTMGASWNGRPTGTFGRVGCFSTQTYKHINSGEGGLLITNDPDLAARAILYSGSYMLYDRHLARPPLEFFEPYQEHIPNFSLRMSELVAAILRPQIKNLNKQGDRWNKLYFLLEEGLKKTDKIAVITRHPKEKFVGSSIQFSLEGLDGNQIEIFLAETADRGVSIKWFGRGRPQGFTSSHHNWRYLGPGASLPRTDRILGNLCDMRIPLTFDADDCRLITTVIKEVMEEVAG